MKYYLLVLFILITSGSAAYSLPIDLTESEAYVRKDFDIQWADKIPSPKDTAWIRLAGNKGNRSIQIREMNFEGLPRFKYFSLIKHKPREFAIFINVHNAMEELNITLEQKVEKRTEELLAALSEMEAMNERLTETTNALWGEMELTKKIQTVLLPKKPIIKGYDISVFLSAVFKELGSVPTGEIKQGILDSLTDYITHDDITLIVMKRLD